jgi:hypothetical protein
MMLLIVVGERIIAADEQGFRSVFGKYGTSSLHVPLRK